MVAGRPHSSRRATRRGVAEARRTSADGDDGGGRALQLPGHAASDQLCVRELRVCWTGKHPVRRRPSTSMLSPRRAVADVALVVLQERCTALAAVTCFVAGASHFPLSTCNTVVEHLTAAHHMICDIHVS